MNTNTMIKGGGIAAGLAALAFAGYQAFKLYKQQKEVEDKANEEKATEEVVIDEETGEVVESTEEEERITQTDKEELKELKTNLKWSFGLALGGYLIIATRFMLLTTKVVKAYGQLEAENQVLKDTIESLEAENALTGI